VEKIGDVVPIDQRHRGQTNLLRECHHGGGRAGEGGKGFASCLRGKSPRDRLMTATTRTEEITDQIQAIK